MCVLAPEQTTRSAPVNKELERLCLAYGHCGYLYFWQNGLFVEVRQFDFAKVTHNPWSNKSDAFVIPAHERKAYFDALVDSGLLFTAVYAGGQYNLPVEKPVGEDQRDPTIPILRTV